MAQNPNAVREPSMDELLASIREIIEESAGTSASPHVGEKGVGDGAQFVNGQIGNGQAVHDAKPNGVIPDVNAKPPTSPQAPKLRGNTMSFDSEDSFSIKQEDVPVQAAMDALAERIGLRRQEEVTKSAQPASAAGVSALNPSFPYAPNGTVTSAAAPNGAANVSPFPVEKVNASSPAATAMVPSLQIEKAQTLTPRAQLVDQQQPLAQASFQAQVQPSYPLNHPLQSQPPQSKAAATQQLQPSAPSSQSKQPMRVKFSPPLSVPTAQLTHATSPVQQMVPTPSTQQQPISPKLQQQPFSFQPPQQKPLVKSRSEADLVTDVKEKWDELEQDFRAEFEKSAELLLRPYIAQWLDEHFHHLFEKILREEIQRMVQNIRR